MRLLHKILGYKMPITHKIFIADKSARKIYLISAAPDGSAGNSDSCEIEPGYPMDISDDAEDQDGPFVAFHSLAGNLVGNDANAFTDVFVRNLKTGATELVSVTPDGQAGNNHSFSPVISGDGTLCSIRFHGNELAGECNERPANIPERLGGGDNHLNQPQRGR